MDPADLLDTFSNELAGPDGGVTLFVWTSAHGQAFLVDIDEEPVMDDDPLELANRLFATATVILEDAIELAVAGQSPRLDTAQLVELGRRLAATAEAITIIANAAAIVADRHAE